MLRINNFNKLCLGTLALALPAIPYSLSAAKTPTPTQTNKPNILFILVDDLGWNDLGFMGSDYYETPNVDKLANSGMHFTDAYAACEVSSPSRAAIMTGKYPARTGITNWIGEKSGTDWRSNNRHSKLLPAEYIHALSHSEITIADALRKNGYRTFIAGKWHLGDQETDWPTHHGFDVNKGGYASGSPKGHYFSPYDNPRLKDGPKGENLTLRLAHETVDFMKDMKENYKDKPFYAYLSFYAVHGAIQTTMNRWQYFRNKAVMQGLQPQGFEIDRTFPVRLHQDNPVYAGLIQTMDDAVGYVLDHLKELGYDKNTLIFFTGDNGGVVSGDSFSTSLFPLRGGKGRQWEGGIREPLIISGPGIPAKSVCKTPVTGTDYYPTILSYAHLPLLPKQHVDGVDITPLFKGDKIKDRALFWHYPHYGNQGGEPCSTIRKGDWKLIYYYEDSRCELYNLKTDLGEHAELNAQYPSKVEELKAELMQWLTDVKAVKPVPDPEYDPVAEGKVLLKQRTTHLRALEKERVLMTMPDWQPDPTWWGSHLTND
ncbi:MAG: sulfatase [Massilibacteroides sp.]|nr:sulfatase [Massilibacteroides sp.]